MLSISPKTTTPLQTPSRAAQRSRSPGVVLAALVLTVLLSFLIGKNFLAQKELHNLTLSNLSHDLEKRAAAVSYFYTERENDLKTLAVSRELTAYLENKALGMSIEYGLGASLKAVRQRFDRFLEERKLGSDPLFRRLAFMTRTGECLGAAPAPGLEALPLGSGNLLRRAAQEGSTSQILVERLGSEIQVIVVVPLFLKKEYSGDILAWINLETLQKFLVRSTEGDSRLEVFVTDNFCVQLDRKSSTRQALLPDLTELREGKIHIYQGAGPKGQLVGMAALWVPVPGTPFGLLGVMPTAELDKNMSPWHFLAVLGVLSLLVVVGLGAVWQSNARWKCTALSEQKIKGHSVFLQNLIDTIPSPIFYKDVAGKYLGCNQAFEDAIALSRQDIIGKSCNDLTIPELAASYEEKDEELLNNPGVQTYEAQVRYADGTLREVIFNKATFRKSDGSLGGLVGVILDITARKRTEEELRLAKAEIEQLVQSLSSILIGLSPSGQILQWNQAATRVLGLDANQIAGKELVQIPVQWDLQRVMEGVAACSETANTVRIDDLPFTRNDGKQGFLGLIISPIMEGEDRLGGIIILGADITERRLLEVQLSHAQKLESIGQLAAGVAHEINTPIQFVRDNTRFMQEAFGDMLGLLGKFEAGVEDLAAGGEPQAITEALKTAAAAADLEYLKGEIPAAIEQSLEGLDRVAKIVRALKDFSHPGTEDKVAVDLNRALEGTITVSRNEWKYVAEVITDLDLTLPLVHCLPQELNQVFLNIIVNAAQAIREVVNGNPEEKKTITVSTRRDEDWAEVRISDTGPGIPEAIRHKIFDPFFTTKEVGKGTGQGLNISHTVIHDKHKGTLTFETAEGVGTTFIIRLPLENS